MTPRRWRDASVPCTYVCAAERGRGPLRKTRSLVRRLQALCHQAALTPDLILSAPTDIRSASGPDAAASPPASRFSDQLPLKRSGAHGGSTHPGALHCHRA